MHIYFIFKRDPLTTVEHPTIIDCYAIVENDDGCFRIITYDVDKGPSVTIATTFPTLATNEMKIEYNAHRYELVRTRLRLIGGTKNKIHTTYARISRMPLNEANAYITKAGYFARSIYATMHLTYNLGNFYNVLIQANRRLVKPDQEAPIKPNKQ